MRTGCACVQTVRVCSSPPSNVLGSVADSAHQSNLSDADKGKALLSHQEGRGHSPYQPHPPSLELVNKDVKKSLPSYPRNNILSPSLTPKSSFPALLPPLPKPTSICGNEVGWGSYGDGLRGWTGSAAGKKKECSRARR